MYRPEPAIVIEMPVPDPVILSEAKNLWHRCTTRSAMQILPLRSTQGERLVALRMTSRSMTDLDCSNS
jgi:hypothetical protein